MRRYIMEHNIYLWAAKVLGDLREIRIEHEAPVPPRRVDPGTEPAPEIPEEKLA